MQTEMKTPFRDPTNWREYPQARGLAGLEPALSALEKQTVDFLLSKIWEQRTTNRLQMWCLDLFVPPPVLLVRIPLEEMTADLARGLWELTAKRFYQGDNPTTAPWKFERVVSCVRHPNKRETNALAVEVSVGDVLTFEARLRFNLRDEDDEENDW